MKKGYPEDRAPDIHIQIKEIRSYFIPEQCNIGLKTTWGISFGMSRYYSGHHLQDKGHQRRGRHVHFE
jgi:hypothetical protein